MPDPFDRLGAGYATVLCHKQVVCCDSSELGVGGDSSDLPAIEATCRAQLGNAWATDLTPYVPLISAGRIIYHGDRARLCLDEIAALPNGATCYLDSNCASTFCVANVCGPPTMCNGV
jgi:hypothetical protein